MSDSGAIRQRCVQANAVDTCNSFQRLLLLQRRWSLHHKIMMDWLKDRQGLVEEMSDEIHPIVVSLMPIET